MKISTEDRAWIESRLLERFVQYCRVGTTSDRSSKTKPSTPQQEELLDLLQKELQGMGIEDLHRYPQGYLLARIPSTRPDWQESIAFLAHVDTSPDAPGHGVRPLIHQNYRGQTLELKEGVRLGPDDNPLLLRYVGQTLITSDGTTLLGADDKAGVAEIMTALQYWTDHPQAPHGPIEAIFTTDEEIGRGTEGFPLKDLVSRAAFTLDGSEEGTVEWECYHAWQVEVQFQGISYHPGYARGRLVNAVTMAAQFVSLLPRSESPEATDGRYGCLWANDIRGGIEHASVAVYLRDFELSQIQRRLELLKNIAQVVESGFPGGRCTLKAQAQYANMKEGVLAHPRLLPVLRKALEETGTQIKETLIRGGTDGSRLTEMGLPTPNIFTGGMNYHSRTEWAALPAMTRAVEVILNIGELWPQTQKP